MPMHGQYPNDWKQMVLSHKFCLLITCSYHCWVWLVNFALKFPRRKSALTDFCKFVNMRFSKSTKRWRSSRSPVLDQWNGTGEATADKSSTCSSCTFSGSQVCSAPIQVRFLLDWILTCSCPLWPRLHPSRTSCGRFLKIASSLDVISKNQGTSPAPGFSGGTPTPLVLRLVNT